jgi:hypothetical protein
MANTEVWLRRLLQLSYSSLYFALQVYRECVGNGSSSLLSKECDESKRTNVRQGNANPQFSAATQLVSASAQLWVATARLSSPRTRTRYG